MTRSINIIILLLGLTICSSVNGQLDTVENTMVLLEYGLPPGNVYLDARATIADNWGIKFNSVAGCIVSEHLTDSVRKHNKTTYAKIIDKFGKEWQTQFDEEVDKELKIQIIVRELISTQPYIIKLDSTLAVDGNGLHYFLTPENSNSRTTYLAVVFGWGDWNGDIKLVTYYELTINMTTKNVEIVSDKIELLGTE